MNELSAEKEISEVSGLHILLAEDEPSNLLLINRMLKKAGHQVTTANNGKEALDALNNFEYDLGIFDMQMPIMDGLEAITKYKAQKLEQKVPFIILTADTESAARDKCNSVGIELCLNKPISSSVLIEAITVTCGI